MRVRIETIGVDELAWGPSGTLYRVMLSVDMETVAENRLVAIRDALIALEATGVT